MNQPSNDRLYTYEDYLTWPDDIRYELIDGVAYMLSAEAQVHQDILLELAVQLRNFLKGKPCKLYIAPFDVHLNTGGNNNTIVQPDLLVVCDKSKLDGKRCNGAPDLVIEIVSPSSLKRDRIEKFNKYLQAGVREYWMVDTDSKMLSVHILKDNEYVTKFYGAEDTVYVHVLENCKIILADVFAE